MLLNKDVEKKISNLEHRIHLYILGKGGREAYSIKTCKQETEYREMEEDSI